MTIDLEWKRGTWAARTHEPTPAVHYASGFGATAWIALANLMRFIHDR